MFREKVGDEKIIEGWIEGPIAQAVNLRGMTNIMLDFFDDAEFVRDLFQFIVELELAFGIAQIKAGADLIGMGDAAASLVGPGIYKEFIWPSEKKIVDGLHEAGAHVRLHICGRTQQLFPEMGKLGCEIIDLDWMAPIAEARRQMGPGQILLGNIDPVAVAWKGTPAQIGESLAQCHRHAGEKYIVGAGCEIVRNSPLENVEAMRDYARSHPSVLPI